MVLLVARHSLSVILMPNTSSVLFRLSAEKQKLAKMSLARALVGCKRVIDYAVKVRCGLLHTLLSRARVPFGEVGHA